MSRIKEQATVFCLRVRSDDAQPWSEPTYYHKRKNRDYSASLNRIWGGIRAHSYEEKLNPADIEFED